MTSDMQPSLDVIIERLDQLERKLDKVVDDHELRLRRLEAWSYGIPVAVVLALGTVVAALLTAFFNTNR